MKRYFSSSLLFLVLTCVTAIVLGVAIGCCDKLSMHVWLNGTHTAVCDFFFRYYTLIGEWIPYVVIGFLLVYKTGWAAFLLADITLSGLIGQGLKYLCNTDRPLTYFAKYAPDVQLQLVDGVSMSEWYSFPSGHTITFFALFMTLAILLNNPYTIRRTPYTLLCFGLALLGGYSRIYLNQHFAEDVLGGMLIGVISTLLLLLLVPKLDKTKFWNWNIHQLRRNK